MRVTPGSIMSMSDGMTNESVAGVFSGTEAATASSRISCRNPSARSISTRDSVVPGEHMKTPHRIHSPSLQPRQANSLSQN